MLAYLPPPGPEGSCEVRMADLMADVRTIRGLIETVTFITNGRLYTRDSVDDIQLLHYALVQKEDLLGNAVLQPAGRGTPDTNAELVLFCRSDALASQVSDVDRMIVKQTAEEEQTVLTGVDVSFKLTTPEAAQEFQTKLEDMRMELFVMYLKAPLPHEKLVLQLQAGGIHTEDINMAEDGCTTLSQELAKDFLPAQGGKPNYKSPTYVAQISDTGTLKVHLYKNGFEILEFSDVQTDRLVELGLAALSLSGDQLTLPGLLSRRLTEH
ncbi:hypothetical protein MFIFM68171_02106 [Madurella fahalii]|uniref:Uncharacterized protein n=1 Tax=Madurella fahalii TaxID=1157608 RepID=A0ABQ0G2A4_9PEZI